MAGKQLIDNEKIARFISKRRFINGGHIDPAVFQLRTRKNEKALSAYRIDGLSILQKWRAGDQIFRNGCCASADFTANQFQPIGLSAFQTPRERHVSIHGIPEDDKAQALTIAQELANIATLHVR